MKNQPKVTISITTWNNKKTIFKSIESAVNQDYPNLEIIIVDNNSTDGSREEIAQRIPEWEKHMPDSKASPTIKLIKNSSNIGFGSAHNQAICESSGEFILLLNSDAFLTRDFVKKALPSFNNLTVGSVQGKLLRYNFEKNIPVVDKNGDTVIDTLGLLMLKNRRTICMAQGQSDDGRFNKKKEIFGADGAVPLFRKAALEDIKLEEPDGDGFEYFDEDFFLYKEDVDLAWRLKLYGWKAIYTPKAIAYHGRTSGDSKSKKYSEIIRERRRIGTFAKAQSFKHQRLMQLKNDDCIVLLKHFPQFIVKELGTWFFALFIEGFGLKAAIELVRSLPKFMKKRRMVMVRRKTERIEMES